MMVKRTMPGWRSISASTRDICFGRAHQRIDMLDRLMIGIMRHGGARDGVQRLAGRIGNQMHVEEARTRESNATIVDKTCGWIVGKARVLRQVPAGYTGRTLLVHIDFEANSDRRIAGLAHKR